VGRYIRSARSDLSRRLTISGRCDNRIDGLLIGGDGDGVLRFLGCGQRTKLWTLQAHKSAVIAVHVEGNDLSGHADLLGKSHVGGFRDPSM